MNHYEKLSVTFLRLVGIFIGVLGVMGLIYCVLASLALSGGSVAASYIQARFLSSLLFLGSGIVLYKLGQPLARIVGKDL